MLLRALFFTVVVAALEAFPFPAADPAKLRRIPRIYNALITSDEQLLPSQAYPAVAPVLHPAPLATYPYPYGAPPYTVYAPDPYGLQAYSRLPGFNDTLQDPEAPLSPANPQLVSLQPQQTIPQMLSAAMGLPVWMLLLVYASFILALSPVLVVVLALKPHLPLLMLRRMTSIPMEPI